MFEVEMKFLVPNHSEVVRALEESGAAFVEASHQIDRYYNAPDRDFAKTDEALRIRSVNSKNFVTYKGPKVSKEAKTRREIEVGIDEGSDNAAKFASLLVSLGYRFVAEVIKERRIYRISQNDQEIECCLDQVEDLGSFVELELQSTEQDVSRCQAQISHLATTLGLQQNERRSYLELLLQRSPAQG